MLKRKKRNSGSGAFDDVKSGGKKILLRVFLIFLLLLLIYSLLSGPNGFFRIYTLFREKENLETESRWLEARIVDLETKKELLKEDDFYIEKQARERLGMAKEDERIYKFVDTTRAQEKKK